MYIMFQSIVSMFIFMGLDQSYVREFNEIEEKSDLLKTALIIPSLISVVLILFIGIYSKPISMALFGSDEITIMLFIQFGIFISVIRRFLELSIRMEEKAKTFSFVNIITKLSNFIFLVILLFNYEKTFRSIVAANVFSSFLVLLFDLFINRKLIFRKVKFKFDNQLLKRMIIFGLPLFPATILSWVLNSMDKVASRAWSNFTEIGVYSGGFKIVALLAIVQQAFTTFWVPISYKWYSEKKDNSIFEKISEYVSEIMTIGFVVLVGLRKYIVLLLGPDYRKNYLTEFTIIAEKGTIRLSGTNLNRIDFWDVEGMEKPDMDFALDHQYGKGHNTMYEYIAKEEWGMFPSRKDILSGIAVMEKLSY